MIQHQTVEQNPPTGKGVAKSASRYSAGYWQDRVFRPAYTRAGEAFQVPQWYARVQYGGRRESVGLGTNTQEEAARRAAKLFKTIQTKGWDVALRELDPERGNPQSRETVGGYLATCEPLFTGRKVTWTNYAYALRKIAREIDQGRDDDEGKFDPFHKTWQKDADAIKLAVLTPLSIAKWKRDFITGAGDSPLAQLRARRNVNSFLLNARTLFGRRMAKRLAESKVAPVANPFDGVELEDNGDVKYVSTFRASELLNDAKKDFAKTDPEGYKVILLALGAGLRRGEIDMLCRSQLDFQESLIRIINTEHFKAKTESSVGEIYVDAGLLAELKKHLDEKSLFVIEPDTSPATNRAPGYCRCEDTFKRVTTWLRAHGVTGSKPLHALRKEFGSIINHASDIHTASRQLRHATIKMTSSVYADNRRRAASAVPIGEMLAGKAGAK